MKSGSAYPRARTDHPTSAGRTQRWAEHQIGQFGCQNRSRSAQPSDAAGTSASTAAPTSCSSHSSAARWERLYDPTCDQGGPHRGGGASGQEQAVDETFGRAGFEVHSRAAMIRRSADVLPWIVHVTLAVPFVAFFAKFGSEAGKDAYAAVKAWAKAMFEARKESGLGRGAISVVDLNGTELVLASDWPDEALDALAEMDWDQVEGGYLVWNEAEGEWIDQLPQPRE